MSMENYLNARQKSERATVGHTYSDEEDEALDEVDDRHAPQGCGLMLAAPKSAEKRASKSFLSRLKKVMISSNEILSRGQILNSSKPEEFADSNFEFDENGIKFYISVVLKYCGKRSSFSFFFPQYF